MQTNPVREQTSAEVADRLQKGEKVFFVDVRERDEWIYGHIPGATNIPLSELQARLKELDPNKEIVFVCQSGNRSGIACEFLATMGYKTVNMQGGMLCWLGEIKQGQ